jgi:hypothetical protein
MTLVRVCDLVFWWIQEGLEEKEWDKVRSRLEIPPPEYTGSLKGTVWDHDAMLEGYRQ